jgi:SNF2 family DNA or RNA helicase
MIRRTKTEVEKDLPPKTRQALPLEMTPKQKSLYNELSEEILAELPESGQILPIPGILARIMRLRQCLVTPRLLGENELGASLTALKEFRESTSEHLAIFTSFRKAIPHIQEVAPTTYVIKGGMTPNEIRTVVESFQSAPPNTNVSIIVIIQSAQSFTLSKAHSGVVIGPDWGCVMMKQAEDRLHRIGQTNPVHINYFLHKDTVEDKVVKALNRGEKNVFDILDREDFTPPKATPTRTGIRKDMKTPRRVLL